MTVAELEVRISGRLDDLERKLDAAKDTSRRKGGEAGSKYASEFTEKVRQAMSGFGNMISIAVTLPVTAALKKSIDSAISFERMKAGLETLMGSAKAANDEITKLYVTAKLPGLSFRQAVFASQQLQAVGFSADKARIAIEQLAKINARGGGDPENFKETVRQFTQIISLGKVTQDNLRIIEERIPEFAKVMKEQFGTTNTELIQKAFEAGKLSMDQFVDGMLSGIGKLGGVKDNIANDVDNMKDTVDQLATKVGQDLLPTMKDLLELVQEGIKWWNSLNREQKTNLERTVLIAAALGPASKLAAGLIGTIKLVKELSAAWRGTALAASAAGEVAGAVSVAMAPMVGLGVALNTWNDKRIADSNKFMSGFAEQMHQWKLEAVKAGALDPLSFARYIEQKHGATIAGYNDLHDGKINPKAEPGIRAVIAAIVAELKKQVATSASGALGTSSAIDVTKMDLSKPKGPKKDLTPDINLLPDLLIKWGKSIDTPAGSASCAVFVSKLVAKFTHGITDEVGKIEAGAKNLVDRFKTLGGRPVEEAKAKIGDLVYFYGKQFGAMKDSSGQGWHVGMNLGDGRFIDSSGGKDGRVHNISDYERATHGKAQFVSLPDRSLTSGVMQIDNDLYREQLQLIAEMVKEYIDLNKQKALATAKTEKEKVVIEQSYREGGKGFLAVARESLGLTADELRLRVNSLEVENAIGEDNRRSAEETKRQDDERRKRVRETADWLAKQTDEYLKQAGLVKDLTNVQQAILSIMEHGANLSTSGQNALLMAAELADDKVAKDKAKALDAAWTVFNGMIVPREWLNKAVRDSRNAWKEMGAKANDRFNDALKSLSERMVALGSSTEIYDNKLRLLAESFGVGNTEAEKIASGMDKARRVMDETMRVEKMEAWQQKIKQLAGTAEEFFIGMFDNLLKDGFQGFFSNVLAGFRDMLAQMAREWIAAEVRRGISNWLTGIIGGAFGATVGGGGGAQLNNNGGTGGLYGVLSPTRSLLNSAAVAGVMAAGAAGMGSVNVTVPNGGGSSVPRGVTVVVNVVAQDAASFKRSEAQIAEQMGRAAKRAVSRNG